MLLKFDFHQPKTLLEATSLLAYKPSDIKLLAGGQSLIAAMKLGLAEPTALIDLQGIPELKRLEIVNGDLHIGSMCTHAQITQSQLVKECCPMLAELAAGIADQQVRNRGTMGGSLANNDPAADWPCGLLAVAAVVHTNLQVIAIDDFLQGIYATVLQHGEIITHIVIPKSSQTKNAKYIKFEQKASRFALVGVAVAALPTGSRIAVTGLGLGTCLWQPASIDEPYPEHLATSDLHASAKYRAHLVGVLARRALEQAWGQTPLSLRDIPPIKAQIQLTNLITPQTVKSLSQSASCTILFSGDAGALGFAKGEAHIQLAPHDNNTQTLLNWQALPVLGGKIATLAGRMVQGLAAQLSNQFFKRFEQITAPSTPLGTESKATPSFLATIKNWFKLIKYGDKK